MKKNFGNLRRPIIDELARDISNNRVEMTLNDQIFFRKDIKVSKRRLVYKVPLEFLKFRKDNGRIASDVLTYESSKGKLEEASDFGQLILKGFLLKKDPDKTLELSNSIQQMGQNEVAVITADGFLINGNRRKLVFEALLDRYPGDERFMFLKVIILPGKGEKEPPPTFKEIEQIENRYQLQTLGKAEYYNFDKALSIQRKIELGMTLEEQLRDDPNYASLVDQDFRKSMKQFEDQYLEPLKCIERYLKYFERVGHYNTVSEGRGDSEGRWQAFLDYYNSVYKKLKDSQQRLFWGIEKEEIGLVEDIAFKIIRKRDFSDIHKKAHQVMRDLPKLLAIPESKKKLFELTSKADFQLSKDETINEDGAPLDEKTKDLIWSNKFGNIILANLEHSYEVLNNKKGEETPIKLLNNVANKLNQMHISDLSFKRIPGAIRTLRIIKARVKVLEMEAKKRIFKELKIKLKKKKTS